MADKVARAYSAKNVLKDETLMLALDTVRDGIIKRLLAAKTPEEREANWAMQEGLRLVKAQLNSWAQDVPKEKDH